MTPNEEHTPETNREKFENALTSLDLKYEIDKDPYSTGDGRFCSYIISTDGYTFIAISDNESAKISIELPNILEVPYAELRQLEKILAKTNWDYAEPYLYFENSEKGNLNVSIRSQLILWANKQQFINKYLKDLMDLMLFVGSTFVSEYDELITSKYKSAIYQLDNPQKKLDEEEQFWILYAEKQEEWVNLPEEYKTSNKPIDVRLTYKLNISEQFSIIGITLQGKSLDQLPQTDDEWCKLLLGKNENGEYIVTQTKKVLLFTINYFDSEGNDLESTISTLIKYEGKYNKCHFVRATFTLLPQTFKGDRPAIWECKAPTKRSFSLLFLQKESEDKDLSLEKKYEDIKQEISEYFNDKKDVNELSNAALLINQYTNPDLSRMYEWSLQHFFARQDDKTIKISKRTLRIFEYFYFKLNDTQKDAYYNLMHNIAYCLIKKRRPEEAHYYIDNCYYEYNNHNNLIQFINSLTFSRDVRALPFINNWLNNVRDMEVNKKSNPNVIRLKDFLNRRRPFALIDHRFFEEARKELNLMKNQKDGNPYQRAFAEFELHYLDKLKTDNGRKYDK